MIQGHNCILTPAVRAFGRRFGLDVGTRGGRGGSGALELRAGATMETARQHGGSGSLRALHVQAARLW